MGIKNKEGVCLDCLEMIAFYEKGKTSTKRSRGSVQNPPARHVCQGWGAPSWSSELYWRALPSRSQVLPSGPLKRPQSSQDSSAGAARSLHLAQLEVFGLERLLDLGFPVPRRVLLLLLLLRGRGRACGQAVQHLPDVEFPHGLAAQGGSCLLEAPASGGTGWEGVRAAEAQRRLRSRSAKERRAGDNPNRKGCDDGRAAAAAAASPLPPRPPRLQWRPTPPPHLVAAGLPPSRAAAAASMAPRPRSPSARPGLGPPAQRSRPARMARVPGAGPRPRLLLSPRPPGRSLSPPGSLGPRPPNARPSRRRAAVPAPAAAVAAAGPPRSGLPGAHARRHPRPRPAA